MTTQHGFVDESIRQGCYRLALVQVASRDLASLTRTIRADIPSGQTRVHLAHERPDRKRAILRRYGRLDIEAVVYETPYRLGDDDQPARDRCLTAMVGDLLRARLTTVVLDTRGQVRDRRDRAAITRAVGHGDHALVHSHRGSRDEPLLALPDAIGWAAGAGSQWFSLVATVTTVRAVPVLA